MNLRSYRKSPLTHQVKNHPVQEVSSRVFRKGVKAKDINGHPPNPTDNHINEVQTYKTVWNGPKSTPLLNWPINKNFIQELVYYILLGTLRGSQKYLF